MVSQRSQYGLEDPDTQTHSVCKFVTLTVLELKRVPVMLRLRYTVVYATVGTGHLLLLRVSRPLALDDIASPKRCPGHRIGSYASQKRCYLTVPH